MKKAAEILSFEEYLEQELKYYDEHPEEGDPIEAHTNGNVCTEVEYKWHLKKWHIISSIGVCIHYN